MFKSKIRVITVISITGLALIVILLSIGKGWFSPRLPEPPSKEFAQYITAFSGGIISSDAGIQIRLAFDLADSTMVNAPADPKLISIRPAVKGDLIWKNSNTLEFRPSERFESGKTHVVSFHLSQLIKVPDPLKTFQFAITAMQQAMEMNITHLEPYTANQQDRIRIKGYIETADAAAANSVQKVLEIKESVEIHWQHSPDLRMHSFSIEGIDRKDGEREIQLHYNARALGIRKKGSKNIAVPAKGDFQLIHSRLRPLPEPKISLQFSENLDENQNLEGLIYFSDQARFRHRIHKNTISIYPTQTFTGNKILNIRSGIHDASGKALASSHAQEFHFENHKPQVRLQGKGVITPASSTVLFPFEAISLAAVDVKVVRVFEDNMRQFFQLNQYDGSEQMRRVGRIVAQKTLALNTSGTTSMNHWNAYAIDLSEIVAEEPGAIYRVIISFNRDYAIYPCDDESGPKHILTELDTEWKRTSDEPSFYGSYERYESYWRYDWSERDNPCNDAYYLNKSVSRNILASNIGVVAKKESAGGFVFAVNDILTTKPLSGVTIELYNFQQQLIESVKTNASGMAKVNPSSPPFMLVARKGEQRAYLRLDDAHSLSLSMFDVSGQQVAEGIKAFAYGERGIWRPGDTLHLNFILEDKEDRFPDGYPVVFELYNPLGQLVQKKVNSAGVNGFYYFKAHTAPDAPTGNYTARFKAGSFQKNKSIRIETIMPNRLRIDLSTSGDALWGFQTNKIKLKSEWLHGATARNLRAEITATLSQGQTAFSDFRNYVFDDPARSFTSESMPLFSGRLDAMGEAEFSQNISTTESAPGVLQAVLETKVYEEGGAFSIDRMPLRYYPYASYAGILTPTAEGLSPTLFTDEKHNIKIVSVDTEGKPVQNARLKVEVYKVQWRWWWESGREFLGDFSAGSYRKPIHTQTIEAADGHAQYDLKIDYPEWGRYLIMVTDLNSGHRAGDMVYIDWPSWRGIRRDGQQEAASMLSFTTDKEVYSVGEKIEFNIPSSEGGRALLSIENGSKVLETRWIETTQGNTQFSVTATSEMSPNVYAHITLLQAHEQTQNDLPIRLYGVLPIVVEDPQTHLEPLIQMPESIRPGEKVSVEVSEKNGQAMTYTLALVDEGLLSISRFRTPDPHRYFYAREALGVKSFDLYDYVLGAFGKDFARLLAVGGDDYLEQPLDAERASRFKPIVMFFEPEHLEKGKTQTHTFTMPQYVGNLRAMMIAGHQGAYGHAQKNVPVKQSMMAIATLPRVLGPGEEVSLPVNVFALEDNLGKVDIEIETNSLFSVEGESKKSIQFDKTGDKIIPFRLKTAEREGVARVKVKAQSATENSEFDIEIQLRNPNPPITRTESIILEPGEKGELQIDITGWSQASVAKIEVSTIPPINLEKRLRYLGTYPHGCTEQIISAAFPQLFLGRFMELDAETQDRIRRNVQSVLDRLGSRQLSNGGLSMWPGGNASHDWISSYGGHFVLEASQRGFTIPPGFKDNWLRYQRDMARRWIPGTEAMGSDLIQAYRLYTLALAGSPEMGAMNRLRQEQNLSNTAKHQLAATYAISGQNDAARALITGTTDTESNEQNHAYTFGSMHRNKALMLKSLILIGDRENAYYILNELSEELSSSRWLSTQSTAFGLMAVAEFYGEPTEDKNMVFRWNKEKEAAIDVKTEDLIYTAEISLESGKEIHSLQFENRGKELFHARVMYSGTPLAGKETATQQNLGMVVRYTDLQGNPINVSRLKQGTTFIAEVSISHPGIRNRYRDLAISRIFPGGWEISNVRLDAAAASMQQDQPSYEDIRDDRVYTYFDLHSGSGKTFKVMLTATYAGKYYLPGVYTEAMYDVSVNAQSEGFWVEVFME